MSLGSHQTDIRRNFESNEDIEIVTRRYVRTRPVDVRREQLRQSIDGRFDIIGIDEITMPAGTRGTMIGRTLCSRGLDCPIPPMAVPAGGMLGPSEGICENSRK